MQQSSCSGAPQQRAFSGGRQSKAGQMGAASRGRMLWPSRITMATGASQRACHCVLSGPASAGQEEGQGPWGGPARSGCSSRLYVGYLAALTPLLRQTQDKQGSSQERKGRLSTARQGRGGVLPAWGLETRQTTPLRWGQAALIPEGLDRANIQRDEHISSGSCRKTQGPGEAGTRLGPASPVLPMTTEYHGIGQSRLY